VHTVEAGKRITLENVLFATDFSPCSNAALPYAVSIARRYGATLHAVHIVPTQAEIVLMSPESWPPPLTKEEDGQSPAFVKQLEKQLQGLPHEVLLPRGEAAEVLTRISREDAMDLLVLGTHGRAGMGKLLLGSVAEEVLRRADCPVLSVGPHVLRAPGGEIHFQHIIFATDFSENSLCAFPYALSLAEEDQAKLTLLHVVEQPAAGILDLDAVQTSLMHRLHDLIPQSVEPWCRTECVLEFGRQFAAPAERILEVAQEQAADLIVLGVKPVRGKLGLITHVPSTAAAILTQANCPVLSVRGGRRK
jgi:nucleotide-binding universal stress UspA family protein